MTKKSESMLGIPAQCRSHQRRTNQERCELSTVRHASPCLRLRKSSAMRVRGDKPSKAQPLDSIPSKNAHVGSNRHRIPESAAKLLRVQAGGGADKKNNDQRNARQANTHQQQEIYVRQNATRRGFDVSSGSCDDDDFTGGEVVMGGYAHDSYYVSSICC